MEKNIKIHVLRSDTIPIRIGRIRHALDADSIRIRQNDEDPTRQKKVQNKVHLNVFLGKCIFLAVTAIISLTNTGNLPEANAKKDSVESVDPSMVTQNRLQKKKE